jgi:hypothetical protein
MADEGENSFLPPREERTQLARQLRALASRRGVGPLVNGLLIEPTPEFFPDRWAGGEPSVRRVLRRLLRYAELDSLEVHIRILEEDPDKREEAPAKPTGNGLQADLWVVKLQGERCEFAVESTLLRDPLAFVAAAARAVAHVYRRHHGLEKRGDPLEEARIDVTTIYLGFGLVTTDATIRHASVAAGGFRSTRKIYRLGTLSPQSMSYLLALHALARGLNRSDRRQIAARLQANPATFFKESCKAIEADEDVFELLGLPPEDEWPEPPDLQSLLGPLPNEPDPGDTEQLEAEPEERKDVDRGVKDSNVGKPVFRVERSMALRMAKFLGMATFILGGFATRSYMADDLDPATFTVAAVGLALLGLLIGFFLRDSRCSDVKCGAKLPKDASACPHCGGDIVGVIKHPKERLAAEEEYRQSLATGSSTRATATSGPPEAHYALDE